MSKVTVRSGATRGAASEPTGQPDEDFFVDAKGRRIVMRTLSILDQMRLLRLLGGENGPYYTFCMRLARVASIDGDPIPVPQKAITFEHLAQRLGDAGVIALTMHLAGGEEEDEEADPVAAKAEAEARDKAERAAVKN